MYTEEFIEPFEKENPDAKWADVEVNVKKTYLNVLFALFLFSHSCLMEPAMCHREVFSLCIKVLLAGSDLRFR